MHGGSDARNATPKWDHLILTHAEETSQLTPTKVVKPRAY